MMFLPELRVMWPSVLLMDEPFPDVPLIKEMSLLALRLTSPTKSRRPSFFKGARLLNVELFPKRIFLSAWTFNTPWSLFLMWEPN